MTALQCIAQVLEHLEMGASLALVSDAGWLMVAKSGAALVSYLQTLVRQSDCRWCTQAPLPSATLAAASSAPL
jgi:16S rRNA C1402 (ribose-2'-O) methylase RsmI